MKKIFTLIATAFVALSVNAQKITFEEGIKTSYTDNGLVLSLVGTKQTVDDNSCYFGTAESQAKFTQRLKTGGKSDSKNNMILTIPNDGKIYICARTGSNSALDRNIILTQNGTEILNKVLLESEAIKVKGLDDKDPEKETSVYPVLTADVKAGTVDVTYPVNGINIYCISMVDVTAGITEISAEVAKNNVIYNIAGQRVNKVNGIAIMNGKKYMVK